MTAGAAVKRLAKGAQNRYRSGLASTALERLEIKTCPTCTTAELIVDLDAPRFACAGDCSERGVRDRLYGAAQRLTGDGLRDCRDALCEALAAAEQAERPLVPVIPRRGPVRTAMAEIAALPVHYRWGNRMQAGAVASLEGYPGAGKSSLATELVACVTSGRPLYGDQSGAQSSALWIGHEENLATALRPRLDACGANVERVFVYRDPPSFPGDYGWLEAEIRETEAGIVVVDPIDAYVDFGTSGDSHRNGDVRARLLGLAMVAEKTNATIVMIRHFRKSGGVHAVYRAAGSLAYSAVARVIISVVVDPEDPERRIAAWSKMSDGPEPTSLAWRVGPGRSVVWIGEDGRTAQSLMDRADDRDQNKEPSALERAAEWLRNELAGGRLPSADLQRRAEGAGHAERTLKRARELVGVRTARDGKTRTWYSELPPPPKNATATQARRDGTLGTVGPLAPQQEDQEYQEGQDHLLGGDGPDASEVIE